MLTAERTNMKTRLTNGALVGCVTVFCGYLVELQCYGQGTIYWDRSEFTSAIAGLAGIRTDLSFQPPLPPGGSVQRPDIVRYEPGLTIAGVTFQSSGVLLIREGTLGNWWLNNYDSLTPLRVDLNGPMLAFGADFASWLNPVYTNFQATVTLDNGNLFTF